jgi:4-amino-4-deoxy-L-arabinose transferase-like glycosyltransferase
LTHTTDIPPTRRWRTSSLALIFSAWAILQIGGLFTPGLLDDVDSVYIQIAREMLQRHDFVTPTIDGIRFFDKPPLMYWMAAGSMHLFGIHDWAARLPLALGVLALLLAVYALGIRFYGTSENLGAPGLASETWVRRISAEPDGPVPPDRAGLYAALAMATCIGPYLYTRFYIPDILIALWMTLSVHLFLIALDRITLRQNKSALNRPQNALKGTGLSPSIKPVDNAGALAPEGMSATPSALLPCLAFAAVTALNLLTKGLIGVIFPLGFVLLYLAFTHRLKLVPKLHLIPSTLVFLAIAAPWHILAALRNPAIAMPPGLGLPARAGWAWFYLYNEHIARFLGRRIPHDYGQVPIPLFWLLLLLWLLPWVAFLPAALLDAYRTLRPPKADPTLRFDSDTDFSPTTEIKLSPSAQEAALTCLLWAGIILGFFTLSSRQEYYHLPALPALALLVGGLLAADDSCLTTNKNLAAKQALRGSLYFLVPLGILFFLICGYLSLIAPTPHTGVTLNDALSSNPALYNLSLGHVFDLTTSAMGFFRSPLLTVALCMLTLGPIAYVVRRRGHTFAANLLIAASMTCVLLAAHTGLVRFYPTLGSKDLAEAIKTDGLGAPVLIDGELTSGSSLLFYLDNPVLLVNGRVNGPWFGSFWPDARPIFLDDSDLMREWHTRYSLYLLTYHPEQRIPELCKVGPVVQLATSGGKTILRNNLASSYEPAKIPGVDLCPTPPPAHHP